MSRTESYPHHYTGAIGLLASLTLSSCNLCFPQDVSHPGTGQAFRSLASVGNLARAAGWEYSIITYRYLVGVVAVDQIVDWRGFRDVEQHRLCRTCRPRAHVAEVTGQRALALTAAVHAHPCRHALGTRVQQAGNVCWVSERAWFFVPLLRLVWRRVSWKRQFHMIFILK